MNIELSVIIVNHHHEKYLENCISSLMDHLLGISYEIILVDNVRCPIVKKIFDSKFPDVKLVINQTIQGFARNCNLGFENSKGRYILFLNPDIKVIHGNFGDLIKEMDQTPDVGAVCGQLLNYDLTVQSNFRKFPTLPAILFRGLNLGKFLPHSSAYKNYMMENEDRSNKRDIDWCLGALLMIKRNLYQEMGKMDERFFMYCEDVDLCYRLKTSGYKNYFFPNIKAIHYYQRDSAKIVFNKLKVFHIKSILYFFWKHKFILNPSI